MNCPTCGNKMQRRGMNRIRTKYRFQCVSCNRNQHVPVNDVPLETFPTASPSSNRYVNDGETIHISYVTDHIPTPDEVAKQYNIDLNDWEIKRIETTDWQTARADKQVNMTYVDGIANGTVVDSGQFNRVWNHRVNITFVRKTEVIRTRNVINEMKIDSVSFAPRYKRITYPKLKDEVLYEIGMPDVHFGLLTWKDETGKDYDIKIAREVVLHGIESLLSSAKSYPVDRILLPFGNDFFNVNNKENTTSHYTPQSEDTRWQKTFSEGRRLMVDVIDMCSSVAPVDVMVIPGNHDEERAYYLGDSLLSWYHNHPNVRVDNSPVSRKYYLYGKNLIGLAHGYYEPINKLALIMAKESKEMWAQSVYQEWHLGDKHHKKDMFMLADEAGGMMIRILRALSPSSAWTFNKGFMSQQASEGFIWQKSGGVIAQFTSPTIDIKA